MTNQDILRIAKTLGTGADPKKFYVYALLDSNRTPFYIGKGQGDRVWHHIMETLAKIGTKTNSTSLNYASSINLQEIDEINLTDKQATIISTLLTNNKIELVIIKWGMTEDEAYMCESSLINMQEFLHPGTLTNIVNGHASSKEKIAKNLDGFDTKARTADDFLKNVAINTLDFKTLKITEPIVFITINPSMEDWPEAYANNPNLNYDDYVYECVRGYWKVDNNRFQKAKYVIALNKQVVIGVYCIDSIVKFFDPNNIIPNYPERFRKNDKSAYNNLMPYSSSPNLVPQGNKDDYNKYKALVGFTKKTPSPTDQTYQTLKGLIRTTELNNGIFKTRQASVTYNYEVLKGNRLEFYSKW